jgi:hypothetical protein
MKVMLNFKGRIIHQRMKRKSICPRSLANKPTTNTKKVLGKIWQILAMNKGLANSNKISKAIMQSIAKKRKTILER